LKSLPAANARRLLESRNGPLDLPAWHRVTGRAKPCPPPASATILQARRFFIAILGALASATSPSSVRALSFPPDPIPDPQLVGTLLYQSGNF
jgi:hypothetical protein